MARVLCDMYINCACCTCVNFNQGETRKIIYVCSKSCSRIIHVRYHMFIKKCTTLYIKKKDSSDEVPWCISKLVP